MTKSAVSTAFQWIHVPAGCYIQPAVHYLIPQYWLVMHQPRCFPAASPHRQRGCRPGFPYTVRPCRRRQQNYRSGFPYIFRPYHHRQHDCRHCLASSLLTVRRRRPDCPPGFPCTARPARHRRHGCRPGFACSRQPAHHRRHDCRPGFAGIVQPAYLVLKIAKKETSEPSFFSSLETPVVDWKPGIHYRHPPTGMKYPVVIKDFTAPKTGTWLEYNQFVGITSLWHRVDRQDSLK